MPEVFRSKRVTICGDSGKYAQTMFQRLKVKSQYSLCEVQLLTGRTHQIRVHFQYIGHPLVGDDLYGGKQDIYNHQLLGYILKMNTNLVRSTS